MTPRETRTPLAHVDWIARQSDEDFDPLNSECQPGNRLLDVHHMQILFSLETPKKSNTTAFRNWKTQTFLLELQIVVRDPTACILFTDGSATEVLTPAAGAAWAVYNQGAHVDHGHFGYGKATLYDMEMAALARGMRAAITDVLIQTLTLHIYVDNKAAAGQIFRCSHGPAQLLSVLACHTARDFLASHPDCHIHVHWCLAHVGIPQNEFVDYLAKQALHLAQPPHVSFARAQQECDSRAITA